MARDFLGLLRDLVVAKACQQPENLLDLPDTEKADVINLAAAASLDDLMRLHQGFSAGFDDVVRSGQPRAALEMLLVRLARRPPLLPMDELLYRLGALEHRLLAALPKLAPTRAPTAARPVTAEKVAGSAPSRGRSREPTTPSSLRPANRDSDRDEEPPDAVTVTGKAQSDAKRGSEPIESEQVLLAIWQELVDTISIERPEIAAVLEHAVPICVSHDEVHIGWPQSSALNLQFDDDDVIALVAKARQTLGEPSPKVTIEHNCREATGRPTLAAQEIANRTRNLRALLQQSRKDPRIQEAVQILGAHIRDVRVPGHLK